MFRLGTDEAIVAGLRRAAGDLDVPAFAATADPSGCARTVALLTGAAAGGAGFSPVTNGVSFAQVSAEPARSKLLAFAPPGTVEVILPLAGSEATPLALAAAGAAVWRLRVALLAEGLAAAWVPADPEMVSGVVALAPDQVPLGLLAVGHPPAQ
jgi:hypothetical protein